MTTRDDLNFHQWRQSGAAVIVALISIAPLPALTAQPEASVERDLTPSIIHHEARCPSPGQGKCFIAKPVSTGYRVLTSGIDLEDSGDHWIADFSKTRNAKTPLTLLRVMDRHEVLHEIAITFPSEPAASATSSGKTAAAVKPALSKKKAAKSKAKSKKAEKSAPVQPAN